MATTRRKTPPTEATYRRWCRKLAAEIGAELDTERGDRGGSATFWVYGAPELYAPPEHDGAVGSDPPVSCPKCGGRGPYCDTARLDPCDADHAAVGWSEAWDKLLAFWQDYRFHRGGISSAVMARVMAHVLEARQQPEGAAMLEAWLGDPRRPRAPFLPLELPGMLADWLAERGDEEAAQLVRASPTAWENSR